MRSESGKVEPLPQAPDAIELRHLRAFVAVADELNFGRAASRLYLSQPALSRQILALERLVGCDLLRRSTHRVELTLAGEALLDRLRPLLRDVDGAIQAARSIGGELAGRINRLMAPVADVVDADADADVRQLREANEALHAEFPTPEIEVRPVNAAGVSSLLLSPGIERPPTLLFLHGGGYVAGSAFGYQALAGALALAAEASILVPEYRLAPEHPFPAALDDAVRAYRWLLDGGAQPHEVALAGDSSGGGLVLSLLTSLRQRGMPMPGRAVLMLPWVDLTCELQQPSTDPARERFVKQGVRYAELYLAGHPVDDPIVSPLHADLSGLPPLLVQAATGDALLNDARALVDKARGDGVEVVLDLYPVDNHVFYLFWSFLPEAAEAMRRAGEFIRHPDEARQPRAATGGAGKAR